MFDRLRSWADPRLFELDVVVHKGPYVIDVNPVVSLTGVDDAVDAYESLLRDAVADT